MHHNRDITGQVFGRLTAIKLAGKTKVGGYNLWQFRCSCGKVIEYSGSIVWRGLTSSCGCLRKELALTNNLKHGCKGTRVYSIWQGMKSRCLCKKNDAYSRYGGRGIKVCKKWLRFKNFLADMGQPPSTRHTLDRVDNSKGYTPSNSRWATKKEQNRNARTNITFTIGDVTHCLSEWAERYGTPYSIVWCRIHAGWPLLRALTEPIHEEKRRFQPKPNRTL
jgi:hypothetical protein